MKIFISWSGEISKAIATMLSRWIPDVLQNVETWVSDHDISAGARWSQTLNKELESSHFGILCLTPDNLEAPWLLYEAGALGKSLDEGHVVPYFLCGLKPTDVKGPLAQFQGVSSDKVGTFSLIGSVNQANGLKLDDAKTQRSFDRCWSELEDTLKKIKLAPKAEKTLRETDDYLEEILQIVRQIVSEKEGTTGPSLYSIAQTEKARRVYNQIETAVASGDQGDEMALLIKEASSLSKDRAVATHERLQLEFALVKHAIGG